MLPLTAHEREQVGRKWEGRTEREVLWLVAEGKSNREIAQALCVTEKNGREAHWQCVGQVEDGLPHRGRAVGRAEWAAGG